MVANEMDSLDSISVRFEKIRDLMTGVSFGRDPETRKYLPDRSMGAPELRNFLERAVEMGLPVDAFIDSLDLCSYRTNTPYNRHGYGNDFPSLQKLGYSSCTQEYLERCGVGTALEWVQRHKQITSKDFERRSVQEKPQR